MSGVGGKRKVNTVNFADGSVMEIMPIGAGNEVGRSCIIVKFKGKQVMLDCGIHPAFAGLRALPFFDAIVPADIDVALISHFHLDHAAAIPYLAEKTDFKGEIYMTFPTKTIFKLLLSDYVKVSHHLEDNIYNEQDLQSSLDKIKCVNYHENKIVNGIKFRCYNAGHVLGAAMFLFEIAGVKVLYTGDFSKHDDRHLVGAENPDCSPDVLIVESTYGIQVHEPQQKREARFIRFVHRTVSRGGRCLIPVFALGRAQELLLILEEHWEKHPELHNIPIYYASSLARNCMTVFQRYIFQMNQSIQLKYNVSNPFKFKYISYLKSSDHLHESGPVVVMASPAMLQSGLSRELFERWAGDSRNGIIIPGYCVDGTLAKEIMSEPKHFTALDGSTMELRMPVEYTSFSAHSDYAQTSQFVRDIKPRHIVLVHGDPNEMKRLKDSLSLEHGDKIQIHMPQNQETVEIQFQGEKFAKVVGRLATSATEDESMIEGVLLAKDFDYTMVAPDELEKYTDLATASLHQKQLFPFRSPFGLLQDVIREIFENCNVNPDLKTILVHECVTIVLTPRDAVSKTDLNTPHDVLSVEWTSSPEADLIADSVITAVLQLESNPALAQRTHITQTTHYIGIISHLSHISDWITYHTSCITNVQCAISQYLS
eukprot:c12617_g1_i2.p1 GENE.c12617_g1_i2~~c12617_g1_i2.p1  ORF type:complete len:654 (+),score=154.22 c12617_g1_i2:38-1999(+)